MTEILYRLRRNPKLLIQILAASFFVNILALATPIYVIQVLQRYVAYGVTSTLITLVAGIIFVSIFEFFFRNIRHRMAREIEEINVNVADRVTKKLNTIKTNFFEIQKNFRPELITRHLQITQQTYTATTALIVIDVPFVLIFLIALYLIHYQLGLITTGFIFVPLIISTLYRKKINTLGRRSMEASISTSRINDNSASRYETIRYFNLLGSIINVWSKLKNQINKINDDLEANKNILTSFMASSSTLLTIIIIAIGSILAVAGEISVGALIGANILGARAIAPVIKFVQSMEALAKSQDSITEIRKFLTIADEPPKGSEINDFNGLITVKDLHFKYPESRVPLFEKLDFQLVPGSLVSVTGSNGSGKSTLIKSLAGIIEFQRGQIFFDKIEMNQLSPYWLRKNLIYVPQEPKFVDGLLLENIIGSTQIKKERMQKILRTVDLDNFVNSDPDGLNMTLIDRGENLPFGIRKRIALARALNNDGQFVILDEPTEALDDSGKTAVYDLIEDFIRFNKTILVSTLDNKIMNKSNIIINLDSKPHPKISVNKV